MEKMEKKEIDWEQRLWEATLQLCIRGKMVVSGLEALEKATELVSAYKANYKDALLMVEARLVEQKCFNAMLGVDKKEEEK